MNYPKILAANLLRLRTELGLTQAQVAALAHVTVETIARLERSLRGRSSANENPRIGTVVRIAEALGVGFGDLFVEQGKPRKQNAEHQAWRNREAARLEAEARRLRKAP